MITGLVRSDCQATIRLTVRGPTGQEQEIDTGFDGWLSLPPSVIVLLNLDWRQRGRALLVDRWPSMVAAAYCSD
jgi:predicted aspartyl protease